MQKLPPLVGELGQQLMKDELLQPRLNEAEAACLDSFPPSSLSLHSLCCCTMFSSEKLWTSEKRAGSRTETFLGSFFLFERERERDSRIGYLISRREGYGPRYLLGEGAGSRPDSVQ